MAKGSKVGLVIGAGVAVGALGIIAMIKFGAPAQGRDEARRQIARWQQSWISARDCYVGSPRAAADPGDAIAIRNLLGESPHCAAELAGLSRPPGVSTGVDEIEQAWADVDDAIHKMTRSETIRKGPALAGLEHAVANLYAAAGADLPAAPVAKGTAIAPLVLGPVVPGSAGLRRPEVRGHVLIGHPEDDKPDQVTTVIVRGPTESRIVREASASTRAVPDGTWAAAIEADDTAAKRADDAPLAIVTAGPVGDNGEVGDGAAIVVKGKLAAVLGAIGSGASRAVIVRYNEPVDPVAIVRSTDGGATWQKPVRIAGSGFGLGHADWSSGAIDLTWDPPGTDDPDGETSSTQFWWHLSDPSATPKAVLLDTNGALTSGCATGGALWYHDDQLRLATADGTEIRRVDGGPDIRACSKGAVAVISGERVFRCTGERCDDGMEVHTPDGAGMSGFTDVFDGAGVIYANQSGDTIAVWRTGVEPAFVRAPDGATLVAVVSWGPQQYLGLMTPDGLHLAPMP